MAEIPPPEFMIIGGPKCGSTSLWHYLRRNPAIFLTGIKEPAFFSNPEKFSKCEDWYRALFADAQPGQVTGEASTTYSRWPYSEPPQTRDPRHSIVARNPYIRLVYVVRHPVDRAFSHYGHHMRYGISMTFEDALERNPIYQECSRYDLQIERWREVLPDPCQLLVITTDDLAGEALRTLDTVQQHIGVVPADLMSGGLVRANERGGQYAASQALAPIRRAPVLREVFNAIPENRRARWRDRLLKSRLGHKWRETAELQSMRTETRRRLIHEFEPAVVAVEEEVGRGLPGWRE